VKKLAFKRGWSVTREASFRNTYSGETVNNFDILRGKNGRVKAVIDQKGTVYTDSYSMGHDYERFIQDYCMDHLKEKAMMEGGMVTSQSVDSKTGDVLLEVEFV